MKKSPLVLLILDGFGHHQPSPYNAITEAYPAQWNEWWTSKPHCLLEASGEAVGLPAGQMGNSEVGHMHISAGRIIPQDFTQINEAIQNGAFEKNPVFYQLLQDVKNSTGNQSAALHVMGLLSPGGIHSHETHLYAFLKLCQQHQLQGIQLHLFLDGRDTPPQSALDYLSQLNTYLESYPVARIASLSGRYFAMDRDNRWSRTEAVYLLLTESVSDYQFETPEAALQFFYAKAITDEFIPPTLIGSSKPIKSGDSIFFFNFRSDRARQLTYAFLEQSWQRFERKVVPSLQHFVCMTEYDKNIDVNIAFPPRSLPETLGEVISKEGLTQLRIAETEKYAHVTFFFNGGVEAAFNGEARTLIPSPQVSTYDLQPEMSTNEIAEVIVDAIKNNTYDVIIANFANADMIGHTGNLNATISAIETIDKALTRIGKAVEEIQGHLLITADHGNAEIMFDEQTKQPHTAHTNEPVPFLYVGPPIKSIASHGTLTDVAPTVLELLGISIPTVMTGRSLITLLP